MEEANQFISFKPTEEKVSLVAEKRRNGFYKNLKLDKPTMRLITEFRKFRIKERV